MRKRIFEIIEVSEDNDKYSKIYDAFMSWIIPPPCVPGWVPTLILALNSSCATIFSIPGAGIPGRFCSAR